LTRIAILKQSFRTKGGLEKQMKALLESFVKAEVEVDLLVQGPCALDLGHLPKVKVKTLSNKRFGSWWSLRSFDRALKTYLKHEKYDAVLGLERHSFQSHYRAGSGVHRFFLNERMKGAGFFKRLSLQLNPFHRKVLSLEAATFGDSGAAIIYTNSHMVAQQIHELYTTSWQRLHVIHNGVDWQKYAGPFEQIPFSRVPICQALNLDPNKRYLGFIGHGFERKGLDLVLQWLSQSQTEFHLLVVGKDKNKARFQTLSHQLAIATRVHFLGTLESTASVMGIMERLILPTRYDPFANVVIEALAMGLDVWTSTLNGACEILPAGSVFNLDQPQSWIKALESQWLNAPNSYEHKKQRREEVASLDLALQSERLVHHLLASIKK
jgi:UDP-glucose:(heptosyl)LPS alpha-1,3-glucosyltransferase